VRKAIIVGVNEIGVSIAKLLVSNGYEVSTISRSREEARICKGVPVYVYVGDPASEELC